MKMVANVQKAWNNAADNLTPYYEMNPFVLFCDCTVLNKSWVEKIKRSCKAQGYDTHIDFSTRVNKWIWHTITYPTGDGNIGEFTKKTDVVLRYETYYTNQLSEKSPSTCLSKKSTN